jgi:fluoride exporter
VIEFLVVALGGAAGCVARYATSLGAARYLGTGFPYGTILVNVVGSLVAGLIFGIAEQRTGIPPLLRLLALTGFLGGFTTFSTFMLETVNLLRDGSWLVAMGSFVANSVIGGVLAVVGIYLGRLVAG